MSSGQPAGVREPFKALWFQASATRVIVMMTMFTGASAAIAAPLSSAPEAEASGSLLDDIIVTATKQSGGEQAQKVPAAITAFSGQQIESMKLTDIQNLAFAIPNVGFDNPGTVKGTANFQIRGLGVNSSVASTAPSVGVFMNGVYLGINQGALFDTFDLEGIEVLRGPQGTLFGRNVTGGAVLIRTVRPSQNPDLKARVRVESGPQYSASVAAGGGLTESISARLAVLYRYDKGYFDNRILGDKHFGKDEGIVLRPSLRFQPSTETDIVLFGEYGKQTGDGVVYIAPDYTGFGTPGGAGSIVPRGRHYDDVYQNIRGTSDVNWKSLTLEATQNVGDSGAITNVLGWRKFNGFSSNDADGTEATIAHANVFTGQHQISEELRYNGTFGIVTITAGAYFFHQKLTQILKQVAINATQGGVLVEDVYGGFGQLDLRLTEKLKLQMGGRYNYEKKTGKIAALASEDPLIIRPGAFGIPGACILMRDSHPCNYQFVEKKSWKNFSPKIGVEYELQPHVMLYATAQKAFRSGGYNVRYNGASPPAPYNPEKQDAAEVGFKADLFDRTTRINGALFYTKIKGLQRDIQVFETIGSSVVAIGRTLNTADATTKGFELEVVQQIAPHIVFNGSVGYVSAKYDKIFFDITSDPASVGGPAVTAFDLSQRLPRAVPWTFSAGLTMDHRFSFANAVLRLNYSHRDDSYMTDYNRNRRDGASSLLPAVDIFDAQLSLEFNEAVALTLYGRNLTNEFSYAANSPIGFPGIRACSCAPNKGRVLGIEASVRY